MRVKDGQADERPISGSALRPDDGRAPAILRPSREASRPPPSWETDNRQGTWERPPWGRSLAEGSTRAGFPVRITIAHARQSRAREKGEKESDGGVGGEV